MTMNRLLSRHPNAATLVPEVSSWPDEEALDYLLRYGPHAIDPNLPSEYINGWYDDDRPYSAQTFQAALERLSSRDTSSTKEDRIKTALSLLGSQKISPYLRSICKARLFKEDDDELTSALATILGTLHLHQAHRLRMVPPTIIQGWTIPGLHPQGLQYLSWLPVLLRIGNPLLVRFPLDKAVAEARAHHQSQSPTLPATSTRHNPPRQVARADSRSSIKEGEGLAGEPPKKNQSTDPHRSPSLGSKEPAR